MNRFLYSFRFLFSPAAQSPSSNCAFTFNDGSKLASAFTSALPVALESKRRLLGVVSEEGQAAHQRHVQRVQNALAQALVAICGRGIADDHGSVDAGQFCVLES